MCKWLTSVAQWNRFSSISVVLKKQIRCINQEKRKELRLALRKEKEAKQKEGVLKRKREKEELTKKRRAEREIQKKRRRFERERLKKQRQAAKEEVEVIKPNTVTILSDVQKVICLGAIDFHPSLHCKTHIFPMGYKIRIKAPSTIKPYLKLHHITFHSMLFLK